MDPSPLSVQVQPELDGDRHATTTGPEMGNEPETELQTSLNWRSTRRRKGPDQFAYDGLIDFLILMCAKFFREGECRIRTSVIKLLIV